MEFEDLCVTRGSKHTMGQWLWSAVHLIEIAEVLWCSMVPYIAKAEFHTSKSVLGCTCILESCFPVKVWIFVLGAKTFVVLLG
jgi:hypothetical protein